MMIDQTWFMFFIFLCLSYTAQSLPYQAHSFNDLDYLINLFNRNVSVFKVDISMGDRQSCSQQSTWKQQTSPPCKVYPHYAEEICCLGMRGDASSRPHFEEPFNTTDQFLETLKRLMQLNPTRKLIIATDYQFPHYFDEGIIEGFLMKLSDLTIQFKGQLSVDTGQDFILQYDRICEGIPLNTDTIPCTKERLKISKSQIYLSSSSNNPYDSRNYKNRFRRFNIIFHQIDRLCKEGFPQWVNKHPDYPLTFWEPSNEQQIQKSFQKLFTPDCQRKHGRSIDGFALACNLDPEMFTAYMKIHSSGSKKSVWSPSKEKMFIGKATNALLATLDSSICALYRKDGNLYIGKYTKSTGEQLEVEQYRLNLDGQIIDFDIIGNVSVIATLIAEDEIAAAKISICKPNSQFMVVQSFQSPFFITQFLYNENYIFFLKSTLTPKTYQILKYSIINQQTQTWFSTLLISQFVPTDMAIVRQGVERIIIVGDDGKVVSRMVIEFNTKKLLTIDKITYGANAKIFVSQNKISLVMQNSMCSCGLLLNNNHNNKCLMFKNPAFQNITNAKSIISLVESEVERFLNKIQFPISACSDNYLFTKILQGKNPSLVILQKQRYISTGIVKNYEQGFFNSLFCGGSNYVDNGVGTYIVRVQMWNKKNN